MKATVGNSGVQQWGGTINAKAFAVGDHARAGVEAAADDLEERGRSELLEALRLVSDALVAHGAALPDGKSADAIVQRVAKETAKPAPDRVTLKSLLSSLADEVKSVAAIASAVTPLWPMIFKLFPS